MQNDFQQTIRLGEPKTFNEQCRAFNNLPKNVRMNTNFKTFSQESKTFLKDKALARIVSLI